MATVREDLEERLKELQTHSDRLKVKLHLGRADLRDRFEEAQGKIEKVRGELKRFGEQAKEPGEEIRKNLGTLLDDAGKLLRRVRETL